MCTASVVIHISVIQWTMGIVFFFGAVHSTVQGSVQYCQVNMNKLMQGCLGITV